MNGQALFGKRIRAIREAASVSRELVAEKADINVNYLGEIERGEKWPSLEIIEQLAKALSVSPPEFFEFEAEETEPSLLLAKVQRVLADRSTEQLQQALRILKALLQGSTAGQRSVLRLPGSASPAYPRQERYICRCEPTAPTTQQLRSRQS